MSLASILSAAAGALLAASLTPGVVPASEASPPPEFLDPTPDELAGSVIDWRSGVRESVMQWSLDRSVQSVEQVETDGETTTITLATDILFEPDKWDLAESAVDKIGELIAEVPDGASVTVHGHTDSIVGAVDNQELSDNRAQAVADVIAAARPDLVLDVAGFANTLPGRHGDSRRPGNVRREPPRGDHLHGLTTPTSPELRG